MHKTLFALISTGALAAALLSPPTAAHAAAASYTVLGHPITSSPGLSFIGDTCAGGGPAPTVTQLERDGGTLGTSALGWSVDQAGSEAGPVATLAGNPDVISTFQLSVHAPNGTTGHAYVALPDDADTWYVGWASLTVPAGGWRDFDFTDDVFSWTRYDAGVAADWGDYTVSSFIGTGFSSVQLGALFGCGGEQFYVDRLVVANAENSATYDFERKPPPPPPAPAPPHHVAHLEWVTRGDVQTSDRVVIRYGQSLWLLGHAHLHSAAGESWYQGRGTLAALPTRGAVKNVGTKQFDPEYYAAYKVSPTQETAYRFTPDPRADLPATSSNDVTVFVQSRVRAAVRDRHLVEGQRLAVAGQVWPRVKRVKVTLQRKAGSRWKNLTSTTTHRGGKFSLGVRARKPGTWKVRVKVGATVRNLGTTTKTAKVRVDKYRPPKRNPSQPAPPPPPPAQDSTPEAPAPVVTPQPTQTTASAPAPPDRPTPTGRPAAPRETARTVPVTGVAGSGATKP